MERDLRTLVERVIHAGVQAPSGDNIQPWRFEVWGNRIEIFGLVPHGKGESMAHFPMSLYLTHGALIENMVISADHFGYRADIVYFPDTTNRLHTASVTLIHDPIDRGVNLYHCIGARMTNRSPFRNDPLSECERSALVRVPDALGIPARIVIIEDRPSIRALARLAMTQIKVIFAKRDHHEEFFSTLRFNVHDAYTSRDGLDVRTFVLSFPKRLLFRYVIRPWTIMRVLRRLGMQYIAAFLESIRYMHAGAYIAVITSNDDRKMTLDAGRVFERLWLVATRLGLSVQPAFASVLLYHLMCEHVNEFSHHEQVLMSDTMKGYRDVLNIQNGESLMCVLRVGKSSNHTFRSLRKSPNILFHE